MADFTLNTEELGKLESEAEALVLEGDQLIAAIQGEQVDLCQAIRSLRDFMDKATSGFLCSIPLIRKLCDPAKKGVEVLDEILKQFC